MSLDEFVASFHALIPPDTPGWASGFLKPTAGAALGRVEAGALERGQAGSESRDATKLDGVAQPEDGASDVAAAFGRIRLSASIPECRRAAEYVMDYCRRVRDSPSASLLWRVPLDSSKFRAVLGRSVRRPASKQASAWGAEMLIESIGKGLTSSVYFCSGYS